MESARWAADVLVTDESQNKKSTIELGSRTIVDVCELTGISWHILKITKVEVHILCKGNI